MEQRITKKKYEGALEIVLCYFDQQQTELAEEQLSMIKTTLDTQNIDALKKSRLLLKYY